MKLVYTTGVFDMLHPGHINILKKAKSMGDKLIVGLQSDLSVLKQKGKNTILNTEDRKVMLEALPFVDSVIIYDDLDQRKNLKLLNPDIYVQGEDWYDSGNRTDIVKYLKENNIKLILFPRTKGISTTEIREKVVKNSVYIESNLENIKNKFLIVDIDKIKYYENTDNFRVNKIKDSIIKNNIINNPIVCGKYNDKEFFIIDGNNRFKALKDLGIKKIPIFLIDYFNENEVKLLNNIHYLNNINILDNFIKKNNLIELNIDEVTNYITNNEYEFIIENNGKYFYNPLKENIFDTITLLNELVDSYIGKVDVKRISEVELKNFKGIKIIFRKFNKKDIINFLDRKLILHSGITWHKLNLNLLNLNLDLSKLNKNEINFDNLRHYYGNSYVFEL